MTWVRCFLFTSTRRLASVSLFLLLDGAWLVFLKGQLRYTACARTHICCEILLAFQTLCLSRTLAVNCFGSS